MSPPVKECANHNEFLNFSVAFYSYAQMTTTSTKVTYVR